MMRTVKTLIVLSGIWVLFIWEAPAQNTVADLYLSPTTMGEIIRGQILIDKINYKPPDEIDKKAERFIFTLNYWNDYAADEGGAGGYRRFFKEWVNPFVDITLDEFGGPLSNLSKLRDWADEKIYEGAAKRYSLERDFEVRETIERTATSVVEDCSGDIQCAEKVFERLLDNDKIREQLGEADALGAFDEAQTRAYLKAAIKKVTGEYKGITTKIDNLDVKINAAFARANILMVSGFKQININQRRIIRNTARIINIQQQHTIALVNIQAAMEVNFKKIHQGIGNIIELQQENLFLSTAIYEGIQVIDAKLINLSSDVSEIRVTQINEIFNNSSIDQKIKVLLNPDSEISQLMIKLHGNDHRRQLIASLKAIKLRQDVVNTAKLISEWGAVAKETLSMFCQDCPADVSNAINFGLQMTNVMGNIATGNYAKAALSVLGLFKEPQLSPELKMLKQISRELRGMERNMNAQFQHVHEHLFALEENLGRRLDIIDLKIDQIAKEVFISRMQLLEELSGIDAKLNYIINQNECIKDVVLVLANQQNQDVCKKPVSEFNKSLAGNSTHSFQDLDNFFRGGSCTSCIRSLFDVSNVSLTDAALFRYAQCNPEGQDNKVRPDRMYEFIYRNLFSKHRKDPARVTSLLYLPASIPVIDSIYQAVTEQDGIKLLVLNPEDRFYKNHRSVTAYANYVLSMFSFMELYDNGRLLTPEALYKNPGFTKARAGKMLSILEGLLALINHTLVQQSLMTGNGTMKAIDELLAEADNVYTGPEAEVNYTLADLFTYNPYVRKNYSAYFLDRVIGYKRLSHLVKSGILNNSPQRIIYKGFSIYLSQNPEGNLAFSVSLTNSANPSENIALFQSSLPVEDGNIGEETYRQNLAFAYPSSILELEAMKDAVLAKIAEMYLITSPELDKPNAEFTREDLMALIYGYESNQVAEQAQAMEGGENAQ